LAVAGKRHFGVAKTVGYPGWIVRSVLFLVGQVRACLDGGASMSGIGAGLFLIGLGAILKYAVTADVSWIRIDIVGVVLMIMGAASLVLGLVVYQNRRQGRTVTQRRVWDDRTGLPEETEYIEERRTYDEPGA
jgi:hypothetical protein